MTLGTYLATAVVRQSRKHETHGNAYLVDLDTGQHRRVIEWDDPNIDWVGRGRERGLRGIAFHQDKVLIAAHNRVLVYTPDFALIDEIESPLLGNLHEIAVEGSRLYLTSTSFNSIIVYDFEFGRFTDGYWLRYSRLGRRMRKMGLRPTPRVTRFDPEGDDLPPAGGHLHINSVYRDAGRTLVSGTRMGRLMAIENGQGSAVGKIPFLTHNAKHYRGGIICNDTSQHRIARFDLGLKPVEVFDTPAVDMSNVVVDQTNKVIAVEGFARGLVVEEDGLVVGGSSPSSVSAYRLGDPSPITTVHLSDDVMNSVHGLARWPYGKVSF